MRRNIRKSAVGKVGEWTEIALGTWGNVVVQVCGYRAGLVIRAGEVIAEASGAGDPRDFRADGLSAADCGDVRTCAWELRCKLWRRFAIVGLTRRTDPCGVH